jgi:hypothetical protein
LFFNAYADDAKGVRQAIRLRRQLDELADDCAGSSPHSADGVLGQRLAELARSLEGGA